jgi:beta-glucosidase
VKGYQGEKLSDPYSIAACLKHYVGYGVSEGGRDYRYTDISPQALWETYLPPYEACVKAGAATLMSSFNDISGVPATSNHYILTEILKNKWRHDGFVVSDWNAIEQLIYQGVAKDRKEAAYKAFHGGVEMDMRDNVYYEYLEQLVAEKKIEISQIDDAVARILRVKFRLGLFDEPYTKELTEQERYLQKEDIALAARLAEESMVLLKNEKNLLPLSSTVKRVALIGPMVKDRSDLLGAWAFKGQAEDVETIYEGMQKEFGDKVRLDYEQGCSLDGNDESGFSAALKTAEASDVVVVCLGESKQWSGENASRSTIALPDIQEKLLLHLKQANKPIVLVLSSGRPLELIRLEPQVEAIIEMWQPGVAGGTPLAGILSGRVNPSGKLSVTFPLSTGQIPVYYNMRQSARPFDAMGDYQDIPTEPLYPFGYGLSYTTFTYSDAKLSSLKIKKNQKITAEVTVTNAGKVEGKETVLWYVSDPFCSISRPMKELKFFEKQSLKVGESRVFRFEIDPMRDLSYTDATGKRFLEAGEFIVSVGGRKLTFEVVD